MWSAAHDYKLSQVAGTHWCTYGMYNRLPARHSASDAYWKLNLALKVWGLA